MQPGDSLQLPFEERRILSVSNLNREARRIVETGLGTVWGEQTARRMLSEAGFEKVETHTVEGDPVNLYYVASRS